MFSLRAWQSSRTTSLQVLFGLPLGLGPSTSYSMHFFTQSFFRSTCPYQRSLFCRNTNAMSSIPSLSLNSLLGSLSFNLMPHIHLTILIRTGCVGMGMCCEKMMMIGWRNAWSMKLRVQGQGEDQRRPGKRLFERTVKHVSWIKRMPWTVANGSTLTRMGVSGWMFLVVPAYPGCPRQTAVKWLLLLLFWGFLVPLAGRYLGQKVSLWRKSFREIFNVLA